MKNQFVLLFKEKVALLTGGRALRTLIVASAERLISLFVHARYTRAHCIRTIHVPNKLYNAFVISTNRAESATHCVCSQIFHACFQRNFGSCGGGEFPDS